MSRRTQGILASFLCGPVAGIAILWLLRGYTRELAKNSTTNGFEVFIFMVVIVAACLAIGSFIGRKVEGR